MSIQSPDKLSSQRDRFEIPPHVTYMNCANMAPQMRSVRLAGEQALRANSSPWDRASTDWFAGAEKLRALAARLMSANPDCIALVPAASYGIAVAAANVTMKRGQSVVILDQQFPSNFYAWRALARRCGGKINMVQRAPDSSWTEAVLAAIDAETAVVAVPNCHWTDGCVLDLNAVGRKARAVGAALVVDASQSLGAYPLDVEQVQPDFLVSVGYKWLLGPYGLAYLYVSPRWHSTGVPLEHSWMTRAGAEDFSRLMDYTEDYRPGARRFDMGEFSSFTLVPMATAALEQVLAWGIESIHRTASALNRQAAEGANEFGGWSLPAEHRAGHILGVRLTDGRIEQLGSALRAAHIHVSIRGDVIRIAPHVYNDESDVERLLSALREFLG